MPNLRIDLAKSALELFCPAARIAVLCSLAWMMQATQLFGEPEGWQIAGIRAAFGDSRAPFVEPSKEVQNAALELCAKRQLGAALDPREVGIYLRSDKSSLQAAAICVLGEMGKAAAPFGNELTALLRESSKSKRGQTSIAPLVVAALGNIGAEGGEIGQDVAPLLNNEDLSVRRNAVSAIGKMSSQGAAFSEKLVRLLADPSPLMQQAAEEALVELAWYRVLPVDSLVPSCRAESSDVRARAARILGALGADGAPYNSNAEKLLSNPVPDVRIAGLNALTEMAFGDLAVADRVAALLNDDEPEVRAAAARALPRLGVQKKDYVERMANLLSDSNPDVREAVASAVGLMGIGTPALTKRIAQLLSDQGLYAREAAARSIGMLGRSGAAYAAAIAELLDEDPPAEDAAIFTLSRLGNANRPFAKKAARVIVERAKARLFGSPFPVLPSLGDQPERFAFADEIAALLHEQDGKTRAAALRVLGEFGASAKPFTMRVRASLKDPEPYVRSEAIMALAEMREISLESMRQLLDRDATSDTLVHGATVYALEKSNLPPSVCAIEFAQALNRRAATPGRLPRIQENDFDLLDHWGNPEGNLELQANLLNLELSIEPQSRPKFRAHLRYWSGNNDLLQQSVTWLAGDEDDASPPNAQSEEARLGALTTCATMYPHSLGHEELRGELLNRMLQLAKGLPERLDGKTREVVKELRAKLRDGAEDRLLRNALSDALNR